MIPGPVTWAMLIASRSRQSADGGRLSAREAHRLENRFERSSCNIRLASGRPLG
ncbi:MAG: hypothetical protein ACK5SX_12105 [Sandaracinobacter sp.]